MDGWLRQSTAVEIKVGVFVDSVDGVTAETALTITSSEVLLSKNDGDWAAKNESTSLVHESNGWYRCLLNTTDTDTLGLLRYQIAEAGALPVWGSFLVMPANVYDAFLASDFLQIDVAQWLGITAPAAPATQASVDAVDDFLDTEIADIQTRLPAALVSGRIKALVEAIAADVINDASVAGDMDGYAAKVWVIKEGTTADHYAVAFYKNGQRVTSGITSPTIQVIKGSDGTDLIAATALTEIGSTHRFKRDESTNKMVAGQAYFAVVSATIDGSTRTYDQQVGRDSA